MADERPSANRRDQGAPALSGEAARQGRIVLDTRTRRWIFIGGLVGFVVLVALLTLGGRSSPAAAQATSCGDAVARFERLILNGGDAGPVAGGDAATGATADSNTTPPDGPSRNDLPSGGTITPPPIGAGIDLDRGVGAGSSAGEGPGARAGSGLGDERRDRFRAALDEARKAAERGDGDACARQLARARDLADRD